jgi:cell division protein ZapA (FtsZ GTPase activity inhibitor)
MPRQKIKGVTINRILIEKIPPMEGLEHLEIASSAKMVEDKIYEIEEKTETVDTLKTALLAAMDFSCQNYLKQQEIDTTKNRLDSLIIRLKQALNKR